MSAVNSAASTSTSSVRAPKSVRRLGCTVNTFLLKPLSNSDARNMARKTTNRQERPPPPRNTLPMSASGDRPCASIATAAFASAKSLASGPEEENPMLTPAGAPLV